jgi:hypothetical protein
MDVPRANRSTDSLRRLGGLSGLAAPPEGIASAATCYTANDRSMERHQRGHI